MAIPLVGTVASALLAKLGKSAAGAVAKVVSKPAVKVAGGAVVTAAATAAGTKVVTRAGTAPAAPPPPPMPEIGGIGGYPVPAGVSGWNQSPGGTPLPAAVPSGRGGMAAMAVLSGQIPMTTAPVAAMTMKAPPGYVLIRANDGRSVAVLKEVAYAIGLRKRPHKTTKISARDVQGARAVQGFIEKFSVKRTPRTPIKKGKRR